jgi:hypothetical protein
LLSPVFIRQPNGHGLSPFPREPDELVAPSEQAATIAAPTGEG